MCIRPKKGFPIGLTPDGKTKYAICDHLVEYIKLDAKGRWSAFTASQVDDLKRHGKFTTISTPDEQRIFDWIPIPCGQCAECKLQRSREWANRLMMEKEQFEYCYFLTLTYDDEHIHRTYYDDPETGELLTSYTLYKRDAQLWLKRLRKAFTCEYGAPVPYDADNPDTWRDPRRVRYYVCGEYGGKTFRPHMHAILFCPKIPGENRLVGKSETGGLMYNNSWLDDTWSINGKLIGWITLSEVTWETCAYVARYCLKKRNGAESDFYTVHNVEPEFSLQSNRPGIGAIYYLEHPELLDYEYITLSTPKKGIKFPPPRYFKKLHEKTYGEDPRKAERLALARHRDEHLLDNSTLSYEEYMEQQERIVSRRLSQLKRGFEDAQ